MAFWFYAHLHTSLLQDKHDHWSLHIFVTPVRDQDNYTTARSLGSNQSLTLLVFFSEKPENKKEIVNFIFAWTTFLCLLEILKQHALPEKEEQVPVKTTFYLGLSRYFTYFCEKKRSTDGFQACRG